MRTGRPGFLPAAIRAVLVKAGDRGATRFEIATEIDRTGHLVSIKLAILLRRGEAFRAGPVGRQRYFDTAARAAAAHAFIADEIAAARAAQKLRNTTLSRVRSAAKTARDAEAVRLQAQRLEAAATKAKAEREESRAKANLDAERLRARFKVKSTPVVPVVGRAPPVVVPAIGKTIVVPQHVAVQVCPSGRDMRYWVDGPVFGGFATMGIGRYLEVQQQPLEQSA